MQILNHVSRAMKCAGKICRIIADGHKPAVAVFR